MTMRRKRSNTRRQTTTLAMPVSSSSVMKMTPLAVPGRWRTSTRPATVTALPSPASWRAAHGAGCGAARIPRASSASGCASARSRRCGNPRPPARPGSSPAARQRGSVTRGAGQRREQRQRRRLLAQTLAPPTAPARRSSPSERKASASASCSSAARRERRPRCQSSRDGGGRPVAAASSASARVLLCQAPSPGGSRAAARGAAAPRAPRLQRAVPVAVIDVDRAHLDAVLARVAHDLRRRVEAHRLAVEQRRGEDVGVVAFEPGRDIDEQREAGGMALGKAVIAEALDLVEAALRRNRACSRWRSCRR